MGLSNLTTRVWDEKTRKSLDDMIEAKLRRLWFENYEANKALIMKHGSYDNMPQISEAIVVGGGWSLKRNIHELKGVTTPVIACDKVAANVCKFVKPFAVCAVNTEMTKVGDWLTAFRLEMEAQGYSMDDVWFIVPTTVNPEVFDHWTGNKICFVNPSNVSEELVTLTYKETGIPPTIRGSNCGIFSIINAITLCADKIVLLGINYCYLTMDEAIEATRGESFVGLMDITRNNPFDVLGKGFVYATLEWIDMRAELVDIALNAIGHARIINCSEGGIVYEAGLIEPCDFRAWKTFVNEGDKKNG